VQNPPESGASRLAPALVRGNAAVAFEVVEIIALCGLVVHQVRARKTVPALVFGLALLEHIRQVVWCDRQAPRSPRNFLTLANYLLVISLALSRRWTLVTYALLVGILIHVIVIATNRPFVQAVCLSGS